MWLIYTFGGIAVAVLITSLLTPLSRGCRCHHAVGSNIHISFLRLQHFMQRYQFWIQNLCRREGVEFNTLVPLNG